MARRTKFSPLGSLKARLSRRGSRPSMSMSREREPSAGAGLLDVVELQASSGRWPAGTTGTVVERWTDRALVEIADERGHTLDLVELPLSVLRSLETPPQETLAV